MTGQIQVAEFSEGDVEISQSQARVTMIGTFTALVALLVGVGVVLWQSYRVWGGLPSPSGSGLILYGGVGVMIALAGAAATWGWLRWRENR